MIPHELLPWTSCRIQRRPAAQIGSNLHGNFSKGQSVYVSHCVILPRFKYLLQSVESFCYAQVLQSGISNPPNIMNTKTIRHLQKVTLHTLAETTISADWWITYRFLYCRGVTMVGSFVPPPTNPRSLTQLSSFLSQVNVRIKSASDNSRG